MLKLDVRLCSYFFAITALIARKLKNKMIKADQYYKQTIENILANGQWDKNPRTVWSDNEKAYSQFITQQFYNYNIEKSEFPINTLRPTFLKGAFYDIKAIYIDQTNIIEEMNPCIHKWWENAVVRIVDNFGRFPGNPVSPWNNKRTLGATYGHTVRKYDLMNKLLKGLEKNPFGRRHSINLNQEQQKIDDFEALQPCAFETLWSVREERYVIHNKTEPESYFMDIIDFSNDSIKSQPVNIRFIDLTLIQRSQDVLPVFSINAVQYVMLGMILSNHLTFKTGIVHKVGNFSHFIQNSHIYDRHLEFAKELLLVEPLYIQPTLELMCEPKDFYEHKWEDFKVFGVEKIKKQDFKLEIAK